MKTAMRLPADVEQQLVSKPVMALDALSKLTCQFADNPDFRSLIEILMLTLSGQFGVPSAFITVRNPVSQSQPSIAFATGKFRNHEPLTAAARVAAQDLFFLRYPHPSRLSDLNAGDAAPTTVGKLGVYGVQVLAPLFHDHRMIGLLGLGVKAGGKAFEDEELDLLRTITNTVTPLIANSFLFMEISLLNTWYIEILDNVKQGVFVFDSNFQLRKVNTAGFQILERFSPDQQVSHKSIEAMPLHLLFHDDAFPGWGRRLLRGRSEKRAALIENLVAQNGADEAIFNVRVSAIRRESGVRSDIIVTVDDVTEQKQSDERLFDLQKFAEKGVMASSIAHELNNFLGLVLGGVELTELAVNRNNIEKAMSSIERLKGSVQQMKRFTAGLMDYGRQNAERSMGNINNITADVLSFVMVQKKYKRIEITTDFDPNVIEFPLDADQIAQLLLNLLNNAADAIAETGRDSGHINVRTAHGGAHTELIITDDGVGMSEEVRSKLFRSRLTTKDTGHGYGLVTCARIVDNHQATVEVQSEIGHGSTFVFRFPHATASE